MRCATTNQSNKPGFVKADVSVLSDPEFEKVKDEFKLTPRVMPV